MMQDACGTVEPLLHSLIEAKWREIATMRRLTILLAYPAMTAGSAFAQTTDVAPAGNNSMSALLIMTGIVLAALLFLFWLVPKRPSRRRKTQSVEAAAPAGQGAQAAAAFSAFEKAKLVGKKAQEASTKNVAAGEPASDEQPS